MIFQVFHEAQPLVPQKVVPPLDTPANMHLIRKAQLSQIILEIHFSDKVQNRPERDGKWLVLSKYA